MNSTHMHSVPRWLAWSFQGVLLFYVGGSLAFNQDFAHLGIEIGQLPLYIGEVSLGVLVLLSLLYFRRQRHLPIVLDPVTVSLLLYLGFGAIYLVAGLTKGYFIGALRASALTYYAAFFFLTQLYSAMVSRSVAFRRLWMVTVIGTTIGASFTVLQYFMLLLNDQLTLRYGHFGHSAIALAASIVVVGRVVEVAAQPSLRKGLLLVLTAALFVLTQLVVVYRSILLSIAGSILLTTAVAIAHQPRKVALFISITLMLLLIIVIIGSALWGGIGIVLSSNSAADAPSNSAADAPSNSAADAMNTQSTRWRQGLVKPLEQGGLRFRISAWQKGLDYILANPITGIGFGPLLQTYPSNHCVQPVGETSNCGNPHNTFLTIIIRMGIPISLFYFGATLLTLAKGLLKLWSRPIETDAWRTLLFLMLVNIVMLIYGGVSLFFESPFLSAPYWVFFGMLYLYVFSRERSAST